MKYIVGFALALLAAPFAAPASAQVTANLPVTCNASGTSCVQATPVTNPDGTNVGGSGGGPSSSQLPPTLGPKTGANSLSVVPNTDTPFPVNDSGAADGFTNSTTVSSAAVGWSGATTGYGSMTFQMIGNASGNTVVLEGSNDGGTTWSSIAFRALGSTGANPTLQSTSVTGFPVYSSSGIMPLMRWRVSSYAGGSTTIAVGLKRTAFMNTTDVNVGNTSIAVTSATLATAANQATANAVIGTPGSTAPTTGFMVGGMDGSAFRSLLTDTSGRLVIANSSGGSATGLFVQGAVASGATDSGNPEKIGGLANSATPSLVTAAQRVNGWFDLDGGIATHSAPTTGAGFAITPVVGSLVSNINGKGSAGNLYAVSITTGATAGYLYAFNSTTTVSDGAVTAGTASGNYQGCWSVAATTSATFSFDIPERYSAGIRLYFSTTACGTLTASTTAVFLKARVQ